MRVRAEHLVVVLFRIVASLGIGGEWVAGAAMVAEIVPEKRRVDAGALLYTAAPMGLFLATFIVFQIQGVYFRGTPEVAWRYVFLSGLIPAFVAILVRLMIKEPERWTKVARTARPARISELFTPAYIALTFSGASLAMINLLTWWSVNAFIPTVAVGLANRVSTGASADDRAGGAVESAGHQRVRYGCGDGVLLTIPRRATSDAATCSSYFLEARCRSWRPSPPLSPQRVCHILPDWHGACITAAFVFYLPELFPTRLRGTGSGFCFNLGRIVAAAGPFIVGTIASRGANALDSALQVLFYVGWVPVVGLLLMPWVIETRGRALPD